MIERIVLVALVVAAGFLFVSVWERRRGRGTTGVPPGLTIATSGTCATCDAAIVAISAAGPDLELKVVDATAFEHLRIRAVPTVILADRKGQVVLRRSGRAAVADAEAIVQAARALA